MKNESRRAETKQGLEAQYQTFWRKPWNPDEWKRRDSAYLRSVETIHGAFQWEPVVIDDPEPDEYGRISVLSGQDGNWIMADPQFLYRALP